MSSFEFIVRSTWSFLYKLKSATENYIISWSKLWKHWKSDKRCYIQICKNYKECDFCIWFNITIVRLVWLSVFISHTCPCIINTNSCLGHFVIYYQQVYWLYKKLWDDIFDNKILSFSKMPMLIEIM